MSPRLSKQLAQVDCTVDLPDGIFLQVGRLISIFAGVEHAVAAIVPTLLRITAMEARVAVRTPRAKDTMEMISTLVRLRELSLQKHDLRALSKTLGDLEEARDWFAHGVWVATKGGFGVRIITGSWQPAGLKLPPGKNSIQRRVVPAVSLVTAKQIAQLADSGLRLLPVIADLHRQIDERLASP